jgi:hypothetical protein
MKESLEKRCKNYSPDEDNNGAIGISLADEYFKELEIKELENAAKMSKYIDLVSASKGLKPENIYGNLPRKTQLLKDFGYKTLKRKVDNKVISLPLDKCSPARVGAVFKSVYYSSLKKLNE